MIILEKLCKFNLPVEEKINIYILFIRSVVEQSCVVRQSSLTEDEHTALERVQKVALRVILDANFTDYTGKQNRKSWLVHGIFQLILLV